MSRQGRTLPAWFAYLDLGCAAGAGALWYAFPGLGSWGLILGLAPWAIRLLVTSRLTHRTAFDLPLSLFLITGLLATWLAYDPLVAWPKFWQILAGVILFYALANAESIGDQRVWFLAFFGTGVALYLLGTHSWDTYPAKIHALTGLGRSLQAPLPQLPGHRLHPNVAGGIMAMMVPFAGLAALQAAGKLRTAPRRATSWLAAALGLGALATTLFGLLMTTSRGAWLGLAAAIALWALWLASRWLSRGSAPHRARIFAGSLLVVAFLILGAVLVWRDGVLLAVDLIPGPSLAGGRLSLLRNTVYLVRDYPFVGAGLGGFMMLYSTYALLTHVGYAVHSHNLYLNVAVEQGLVALLSLAWMGVVFAVAAWRGLVRGQRTGTAAFAAASMSLVVLLVHGLADDVLYGSRAVMLMFVPLAFAVPFAGRQGASRPRWWTWVLPLGAVIVLLAALVGRGPLLSLAYSNLGALHQTQTELSVYSWPEWPIQDAVRLERDLSQPVAEFQRALQFDPANPTANRRLGMIALSLGDYEDALRYLEAAYAREPGNGTTRQLLGEAYIVNGRQDEGERMWAGLEDEVSQLKARAFWYDYIGDVQREEWIRQAVGDR